MYLKSQLWWIADTDIYAINNLDCMHRGDTWTQTGINVIIMPRVTKQHNTHENM